VVVAKSGPLSTSTTTGSDVPVLVGMPVRYW
jgi:hypothetical protein